MRFFLIVVLGSKPGAQVPRGSVVYGANAALGYYHQEVSSFGKRVLVFSGSNIRAENDEKTDLFISLILSSRADYYVVCNPYSQTVIRRIFLENNIDDQRIEFCSASSRRSLLRRMTGYYYPLFTLRLFREKSRFVIAMLYGALVKFIKNIFFSIDVDYSNIFRPSTGVYALLFAIRDNGVEGTYIVCGIGVNDRFEYGYMEAFNSKKYRIDPHVMADIRVLKKLKKKYRLMTTSDELSTAIGIPMFINEKTSYAQSL